MSDFRRGVRLGIDVGKARVGVARCDPDGLLATPVETVARAEDSPQRVLAIAQEENATALYVGLLWMQRLRAALSQMWGQQFPPPGFLNTKVSDVIALVAAFLASLLTIGFGVLATSALRLAGSVRLGSLVVSILVAWLLFTVMIARLPHDPVPLRRCAGAGLLAAIGFEGFKQVGSIYLQAVLHSPAGAVFGPVLGLMVFAYMTARLVLFATAWAAERDLETELPGIVVGS